MAQSHGTYVLINEGILSIGGEILPLHRISYVWTEPVPTGRSRALSSCGRTVAYAVLVGGTATIVLSLVSSGSKPVIAALAVTCLVIVGSAAKLFRHFTVPTKHALVVKTASSETSLVSPDLNRLEHLKAAIAKAVANPETAAFHQSRWREPHRHHQLWQSGVSSSAPARSRGYSAVGPLAD